MKFSSLPFSRTVGKFPIELFSILKQTPNRRRRKSIVFCFLFFFCFVFFFPKNCIGNEVWGHTEILPESTFIIATPYCQTLCNFAKQTRNIFVRYYFASGNILNYIICSVEELRKYRLHKYCSGAVCLRRLFFAKFDLYYCEIFLFD